MAVREGVEAVRVATRRGLVRTMRAEGRATCRRVSLPLLGRRAVFRQELSERAIHGLGVVKDFSQVGLEQHDVRALAITFVVLAPHAAPQREAGTVLFRLLAARLFYKDFEGGVPRHRANWRGEAPNAARNERVKFDRYSKPTSSAISVTGARVAASLSAAARRRARNSH